MIGRHPVIGGVSSQKAAPTGRHMKETAIREGVCEHRLASWEDFGPFVATQYANSPACIYRGQADAAWKIQSTLDRLEARYPRKKNYWSNVPEYCRCCPTQRDVHLAAFQEAVRGKRGVNPPTLSEDEWWALAQHHGLATFILDWTYSPFVALFFEFEEFGYVDAQTQEYRVPKTRTVHVAPFHMIGQNATDGTPSSNGIHCSPRDCPSVEQSAWVIHEMPKGGSLGIGVRDSTSGANPCRSANSRFLSVAMKGKLHCTPHSRKDRFRSSREVELTTQRSLKCSKAKSIRVFHK
ncbi:MAG: FRG domain-containing protein [Pirellulaceae bacterium]